MTPKTLLLTMSGADDNLIRSFIAQGLLPNLTRMREEGASGSIASPLPVRPDCLWTTVATGALPHEHGVLSGLRANFTTNTFESLSLDEACVPPFWRDMDQNAHSVLVVNWPLSKTEAPLENGIIIPDTYFAETDIAAASGLSFAGEYGDLSDYKIQASELDAESLRMFLPRADLIDPARDNRLDICMTHMAKALSVNSLATYLLAHKNWDLACLHYDVLHDFQDVFLPYHPPQGAAVDDKDFAVYAEVVKGAYCLFDMMLGNLQHIVGPECTIILISESGYHERLPLSVKANRKIREKDHARNGKGIAHILGPDCTAGRELLGLDLRGLAPMVLCRHGLGAGEDVLARPWLGAFKKPPEIRPRKQVTVKKRPVDFKGQVLLPKALPEQQPGREFFIENHYLLARSFQRGGEFDAAAEILQHLIQQEPGDIRFYTALFNLYLETNNPGEAKTLVDKMILYPRVRKMTFPYLALARLSLNTNNLQEACGHLDEAEKIDPGDAGYLSLRGRHFLMQARWAEALDYFEKAHKKTPHVGEVLEGLVRCYSALKEDKKAMDHALASIEIFPNHALSHYYLGLALMRQNKPKEAECALKNSLALDSHSIETHERLADLYQHYFNDIAASTRHTIAAQSARERL